MFEIIINIFVQQSYLNLLHKKDEVNSFKAAETNGKNYNDSMQQKNAKNLIVDVNKLQYIFSRKELQNINAGME